MRATDFLNEEFRKVGNIAVIIDDHTRDQAIARGIPDYIVNVLIKKIPQARRLFAPMSENQKFYIWSDRLGAGLGLRRRSDKDGYMRVAVNTAINVLFDSPEPIFRVR